MGRADNNIQEKVICSIPPNFQCPRPCQTVGRSTRRDTKHNKSTIIDDVVGGGRRHTIKTTNHNKTRGWDPSSDVW